MTDGLILTAGAGEPIAGAGMTLKVGVAQPAPWSLL
jgi:hypothetical protein